MTTDDKNPHVREIIATFTDSKKLCTAIDELSAAGFTAECIDLLASDDAVTEKLPDIYHRVNTNKDADDGPPVEYVAKETVGESFRNMIGAMGWYGATLGGGVLLISAGLIGSPILAALAAAPAVGGAVGVVAKKLQQNEAEALKEQIDLGHILLFVRTDLPEQEERAALILQKYSIQDLTIVDAPQAA